MIWHLDVGLPKPKSVVSLLVVRVISSVSDGMVRDRVSSIYGLIVMLVADVTHVCLELCLVVPSWIKW